MTDLDTLGKLAEESVEIQTPADPPELSPVTEQGGYVEITGDHHDRYYVIPASISTRSEIWYSLILFTNSRPQAPCSSGSCLRTARSGSWLSYVSFLSAVFCYTGPLSQRNGYCRARKILWLPLPMN